jgi:hypothetical protein
MSNAGLSNLAILKEQVLAPGLLSTTEFDAKLTSIGLGMAGAMEKYCNRKWKRTVGATHVCGADRDFIYLPRSPVEAIIQVELKSSEADGWQVQIGFVLNSDNDSGYVKFAGIGPEYARLRFTYTGGYFWNELEPTEMGYPTATPSGASLVPDALKLAWFQQCRETWAAIDKLGDKITEIGSGSQFVTGSLSGLDLSPAVKLMLSDFRRLQLS